MSSQVDKKILFEDTIAPASHWSMFVKKNTTLQLIDEQGGANVGMLFYNPINLLERYNAPDTLKCQHTFKLTKGHCLYSDMGRIFCSITQDTCGWHDTVCGNSHKKSVEAQYGESNYQLHRNERFQNGTDAFLVELAKYGLGKKDLAANLNLFSKVFTDEKGDMVFDSSVQKPNQQVDLRFEMDTLVVFHTCPHPMNPAQAYPKKPITYRLLVSDPVQPNDECMNSCDENKRGFKNTQLFNAIQVNPIQANAPQAGGAA